MNKIYLVLFLAISLSACTNSFLESAETAYAQKDYGMAVSMAKFARKASSDNSPEELHSLYILARSYEAEGDVKSAKYVYNMVVQSYPNTPEGAYARSFTAKH